MAIGAAALGFATAILATTFLLTTEALELSPDWFRRTAALTIIGVVGVMVVTILLLVRHFLVRPLDRLTRAMGRAEEGDFLVRADVSANDEVGRLARAFNRLLRAITDLQVDVIDAKAEKELEHQHQGELAAKNAIIVQTNDELSDRVRDLELLASLNRTLTSSLDLQHVLRALAHRLADSLSYDRVAFWLRDQGGASYRYAAGHGHDEAAMAEAAVDAEAPMAGTALPISLGGRPVGVMQVERLDDEPVPESDLPLLAQIADQTALAVRNGLQTRRMMELAIRDELTGLYNRRHLMRRLGSEFERARRFGYSVATLVADIDHFKEFNDRYGHLAGDKILAGTARLLRDSVRKVDTVARYGGEEFVLLLPRAAAADAIEVAEKLRRIVAEESGAIPGFAGGEGITLSIGVAVFPGDAESAEGLLEAADRALYASKDSGRDRVTAATLPTVKSVPGTA